MDSTQHNRRPTAQTALHPGWPGLLILLPLLLLPCTLFAMVRDKSPNILLCFGDSITQNGEWVGEPSAPDGWIVRNAGRSGRRAAHIPEELPAALDAHRDATHLLIFLGVNDLPARDPRPGAEKVAAVLADIDHAVTLALPRFRPGRIILAGPANVDPARLSETNLEIGRAHV